MRRSGILVNLWIGGRMTKIDYKKAYENILITNSVLIQENHELNLIIEELKQWLKEVKTMYKECNDDIAEAHFNSVLDKIAYLEVNNE